MIRLSKYFLIFLVILATNFDQAFAEQIPDNAFNATQYIRANKLKTSARILIDNAHHNYHTRSGRFSPLAKLLEGVGYKVGDTNGSITAELLSSANVLVIANALSAKNYLSRSLPAEEAFSENEIQVIIEWVKNGGSLLLIADHMPYPGAVQKLARKFGYSLYNGFAVYLDNSAGTYRFEKKNMQLNHPIMDGFSKGQSVDSVFVFAGSAFRAPQDAINFFSLPNNFKVRFPVEEWEFNSKTPFVYAEGLSQGAISKYGQGRVAVFAEAAMFTAQNIVENGKIVGKVGFSIPEARDNPQFIINLFHWLVMNEQTN